MKLLSQERRLARQIFPMPRDGASVEETPPCLAWIAPEGECRVRAVLYRDGKPIWECETDRNYAVPDGILPPGRYEWDIFTADAHRGLWSFTVAEDAVPFLRPTADELLSSVPEGHPRHLFAPSDIEELKRTKPRELATLGRNAELALQNPLPDPPRYHTDPTALPYREYFGAFRDFCDRDLVALSLASVLLSRERYGGAARERLLWVCDLATAGPCSLLGIWGDEVGLSLARCLPSVYDLLYPLLDERERRFAAETVALYAEQCERRLRKLDFCENPGDSHAGRLPAYLGEAALVLSDSGVRERGVLHSWLEYAMEIYGGIFPYYGGSDGAWAEGTFYATSYTRWFLPFFSAVERYTGKSYLTRPFYRRLTHYFLHFADPNFENHPFGDGYWCHSEDAEWPGFFAQSPLRYYAERFGPRLARERADAAVPELFRLHLLDVFLPSGTPDESRTGEAENFMVFSDVGYISMHTDLADTARDTACLIRASRFGSDSHRHPDQGGFALFHRGVALVSPSGYFGRRYGTNHHRLWLNASVAHNVPLIDGQGQYPNSHLAVGEILSASETDGVMKATVSAGSAYPIPVKWHRHFTLEGKTLTVTDEIESPTPVSLTYPLHFLSRPSADGGVISLTRHGVSLTVRPIEGLDAPPRLSDSFEVDLNDGEPSEYHVTMPRQYHAYYTAPAKTGHTVTVRFEVG